jgi:pimeloyl-ACP methyl ester carboxylesterase
MGTITSTDGTEIHYKDWGTGEPIMFSHGWPLSADAWDAQMLFFGRQGYVLSRTIVVGMGAPVRRGTGTTTTRGPMT